MKITVKSKEYGLSWGLGCYEIYCDSRNCDISEVDEHLFTGKLVDQHRALSHLTLSAMQNWCELNDVEFLLTYREFQEWMSEQSQEVANSIITDWKKSKYMGKTIGEYYFGEIPEEAAKTAKKKLPSVKSTL